MSEFGVVVGDVELRLLFSFTGRMAFKFAEAAHRDLAVLQIRVGFIPRWLCLNP